MAGAGQLRALIEQACAHVAALVESEELAVTGLWKAGFDVKRWIERPADAPEESYLAKSEQHTQAQQSACCAKLCIDFLLAKLFSFEM